MSFEDVPPDDQFFAGFDKQSFKIEPLGFIDREAICWAYNRLSSYRVFGGTKENDEMAARLLAMIQK